MVKSSDENLDEYYLPWEKLVDSLDGYMGVLETAFNDSRHTYVWRGVTHASFSLHSSLYRRLAWTSTSSTWPTEEDLQAEERRILAAAHRWGLHTVEGYGRLSVLRQLALLQHYGTPTRLVDVSLNALIALWFAVEDGNGSDRDKADGRVFAIDTTDRVINETDEYRSYEDMLKRPWRPKEHKPEFDLWESKDVAGPEWSTSYWVWIPSGQEPRIRSQHGAFLFGGVPKKYPGKLVWPKGTNSTDGYWGIERVREATSVPLRLHLLDRNAGRIPEHPTFTIRVAAKAKSVIRRQLATLFGYSHQTLFGDLPGFARFGNSHLRTTPP